MCSSITGSNIGEIFGAREPSPKGVKDWLMDLVAEDD
jgi:hypothetical protein